MVSLIARICYTLVSFGVVGVVSAGFSVVVSQVLGWLLFVFLGQLQAM